MLSWSDIENWDEAEVAALAARVTAAARSLHFGADALAEWMDRLPWDGAAAVAAREACRTLHENYVAGADELGRYGACIDRLADTMYPLMAAVRRCSETAAQANLAIGEHDGVVDTMPMYSAATDEVWSMERDRRRLMDDLAARVGWARTRATEIDDAAAAGLRQAADGEEPPDAVRTVPASATAATEAAFWETLTQAERTELLVRDPASIGNLDGIPADVRDAANRRVLAAERVRLSDVADQLREHLNGEVFGGLFDDADVGLEQTEKRLAALDEIARTLEQGHRQLLVLDNGNGEDTLAAIGTGNVATATHVAVFVPGLGSDVAGDMFRYDGEIDTLRATTSSLLPDGDSVACVTWMNYQAPHLGWSLLDPRRTVLSPMAAVSGARRLASFLDGLDASRAQDPHLTLLGHSYGSLTAALSLRDAWGTGVDELVAVGSPGLGFDDAASMSVPPGHVFVGEAPGDVVADLGVFGTDPGTMAGVKTVRTDADEQDGTNASRGHSDYLTEGTTAQREIAMVVAGLGGAVTE